MHSRKHRDFAEWGLFAAFVGPNLFLLAVFAYWPLVQNAALSFTEWDMIATNKRFVGIDTGSPY
jgi:ABC-type sugar transport system permease subunit